MGAVLNIFGNDLRRLFSSPLALALIVVAIAVTSACAWCAIGASWSPYQNANGIRVAVVNEDQGATPKGADKVDVGSLVVQAVGQDNRFKWDVVDAQTARAGLESGDYYAEIVIPADFSQQFCSVIGGKVGQPTVQYYTNQKRDAAALELTGAGSSPADAMVEATFSDLVSDVAEGVTQNVAKSIVGDKGSVDSQVQVNLEDASKRLKDVSSGFGEAGDSIDKWRETVESTKASLDDLNNSLPGLRDSITHASDTLADTRTSAHKVSSEYASDLSKNGSAVVSGVQDIADRMSDATEGITGIQDKIADAREKALAVIDSNEEVIVLLESIENPSDEVKKALSEIRGKTEDLQNAVNAFEDSSSEIDSVTSEATTAAEEAADDVADIVDGIAGFDDAFNTDVLPKLDKGMDALALLIGSADSAVSGLEVKIAQAKSTLDELDGVFKQTKKVLEQTSDSLGLAEQNLESARTSLTAIADSEFVKKAAELAGVDAETYASFMAAPMSAKTEVLYPMGSYGTAVAPFYTSIAMLIFAIALVILIKPEAVLESNPEARPWQAYLGRLFLLMFLALLQAAIVCAGDLLIGVQTANPIAFVGAGVVSGMAFASVAYALCMVFRNVGKALAFVLLLLQIPVLSGAYPLGLMPAVFQGASSWMPATYAMGALYEGIGGLYRDAFAADMIWLVVFGVGATLLALVLRPIVVGLNGLFYGKLRSTGLFAVDDEFGTRKSRVGMPAFRAMLTSDETRPMALERARSFQRFYGKARYVALAAMILLPVLMLVGMSLVDADADGKVALTIAFFVVMALLSCFVIAIEYIHNNVKANLIAVGAVGSGPRRPPAVNAAAPYASRHGHVAQQPAKSRHTFGKSQPTEQQTGLPSTWKPSNVNTGSGKHARGKGGKRQ